MKKTALVFLRVLVLLTIVISFIFAFLSLPFWQVKNIYVEGNKILSADFIKSKVNIPFNENIFFFDRSYVLRKLFELPQIKSASVSLRLPNSIIIKIKERNPFAVVTASNKYLIIDNEGYIIESIEAIGSLEKFFVQKAIDLPTVLNLPKEAIIDGNKIDPKAMKVIEFSFLKLKNFLKDSKFEFELKDGQIDLIIDGAFKIKLGVPEDIEEKSNVLSKILDAIKDKRTIEYIDVRVDNFPVVKFKSMLDNKQ